MSNKRRIEREKRLPLGPNYRALCRFCRKEVPVGRRTFCSNACVHEHLVKSDPSYARKTILKRDKGMCQHCGLDTFMLQEAYETSMLLAESMYETDLIQDRLRALGFNPNRSIQEVDHIVAVKDGGLGVSAQGLQLLCYRCHLDKTKLDMKSSVKSKQLAKKKKKT